MRMLLPLAALLLLMAPGASAQEIGRTTINDREIVLFENGRWRYAVRETEAGAECEGLVTIESSSVPLTYCLSDDEWQRDEPFGAFEAVFQHKQAEVYVGLITEAVEIPRRALRDAIVSNAQSGAGLQEVEILEETSELELNGREWSMLKYRTKVDGLAFTYWNYFLSADGNSLQFLFWAPEGHVDAGDEVSNSVTQTLRLGS